MKRYFILKTNTGKEFCVIDFTFKIYDRSIESGKKPEAMFPTM